MTAASSQQRLPIMPTVPVSLRGTSTAKVHTVRSLLVAHQALRKEAQNFRKRQARGAYTLVLIDGDALDFADGLVRRGLQGGEAAAHLLLRATFQQMKSEPTFRHDEKIVVKVHANLKELSRKYMSTGVLYSTQALADFVSGFNGASSSCELIDAGHAEGGVNSKLQGTLDRELYSIHCQRIILGGSANNALASYLKGIYDTNVLTRVWLLKGPTIAPAFQGMLHRFKQVDFPRIFRAEQRPSRSPSTQQDPPALPVGNKRKADVTTDEPRQQRRLERASSDEASVVEVAES